MALFGLLNVNKPSGVTSRRVVDQIQRLVKPAKVGHAGTLDPLASGVLVIGIGQGTRLVEYVQQMPKRYRGTFLLGRSSDTEDIEGVVTAVPNAPQPSRADLERAIAELTGEIEQRPPDYSALKISGQRAYALARAGEAVDLAPRKVIIYRAEVIGYDYPELCIEIECGSGTYIRSFGRDLAERVGTAAVMSALVRCAIGQFTLEAAFDAGQLTRDNVAGRMLSPALAVRGLMPEHVISEPEIECLRTGRSIAAPPDAPSSAPRWTQTERSLQYCGSTPLLFGRPSTFRRSDAIQPGIGPLADFGHRAGRQNRHHRRNLFADKGAVSIDTVLDRRAALDVLSFPVEKTPRQASHRRSLARGGKPFGQGLAPA